ncbi:Rieske 2Fe-2S domain-containing protein [Streptomyces sp. NPDC001667]
MEHTIQTSEPPYPNGWFAIAFSGELRRGEVIRRRLMGEEIVAYRTRGGRPVITSAYCPHLGAHLGYGGTVDDDILVCPFHRFGFDPTGHCVRTGYGTRPPKIRLDAYPVRETNGAIMVWRHADGRDPDWEIPELREPGFPSPIRQLRTLTAYPQDINENAFDSGHFPALHGYHDAQVLSCAFDGVRSKSDLLAQRRFPLAGVLDFPLHTEGYGVGFTRILAEIPQIRCLSESYYLSTPVAPHLMEFRMSLTVRAPEPNRTSSSALAAMARALSWMLTRSLGPTMRQDLKADYPIWNHKVYVEQPRLANGDGPIGKYRKWVRQFYTQSDTEAGQASGPPGRLDISSPPPGLPIADETQSQEVLG